MSLIWRVLATVVAVNMLTLTVFVVLASLQYSAIFSGLVKDRLLVLMETVSDPFQAVADIGVPLSSVRNAEALLERARLSDESITGIYVISHERELVHFAASHPVDPGDVLDLRPEDAPPYWESETAESFLIGKAVQSAFGAEAGSIVLEYPKRDARISTQAMAARLSLLAAILVAVTTLVGWGAMRLVLRDHVRVFDGILRGFDRFERGFWRGRAAGGPAEPDIAGFGVSTTAFRDLLEASEKTYRDARQELEQSKNTVTDHGNR